MKTMHKIILDFNNGKYSQDPVSVQYFAHGAIIDGTKSFEWNKEEVLRLNGIANETVRLHRIEDQRLYNQMVKELLEAAVNETSLNMAQAEVLFEEIVKNGHNSGILEIINFEVLVKIFDKVQNAK